VRAKPVGYTAAVPAMHRCQPDTLFSSVTLLARGLAALALYWIH